MPNSPNSLESCGLRLNPSGSPLGDSLIYVGLYYNEIYNKIVYFFIYAYINNNSKNKISIRKIYSSTSTVVGIDVFKCRQLNFTQFLTDK